MAPDVTPSHDPVWHTLAAEDAATRLGTDPQHGLPGAEAAARPDRYGPNALRQEARRGPLRMLLALFTDFMILLLVAAAIVSGIVGDAEEAVVILGIVVLNAAVGFVQEFRAERAMAALKQLATLTAVVVRDGRAQAVPAERLVPGDVVLLEAGSTVPADLQLLEAVDLRLGEAALTGESLPVEKHTGPGEDADLPLGDRRNMAFKGTAVLYGRGRGLVVATGMATEHCLERRDIAAPLAAAGAVLPRADGPRSVQGVAVASDAAETVVGRARAVGAGLVVMSAYGRSGLRDLLFGSCTRRLLTTSPFGLFVHH